MSSLVTGTIASADTVQPRWSLDSIDWRTLRHDAVADNEALFYLIAAASFIEATTDLYTENLLGYFAADEEITVWLRAQWLPEELQHGQALRRYVQLAWPDFDWDGVYEKFLPEFAAPLVAWSTFLYAVLLLVIVLAIPGGIAELIDFKNRRPLETGRAIVPRPELLAKLLGRGDGAGRSVDGEVRRRRAAGSAGTRFAIARQPRCRRAGRGTPSDCRIGTTSLSTVFGRPTTVRS